MTVKTSMSNECPKDPKKHEGSKRSKKKRSKIFDDVFRTMAQKMPSLLIPVINEAFGTNYSENTKIEQLRNEHFEKNGEIITDALIRIKGIMYHIECQSKNDKTMSIRMFEYDSAIALEQTRKKNKGIDSGIYEIDYPNSCVIYIRSNKNTPEKLQIKLNLPNGESVTYETKTIKISDYSMEDLFSKKLLMFLPFYIVRYERKLKSIASSKKRSEKLIAECDELRRRLEDETYEKREEMYTDLIKLIKKVSDHVLRESKELKRGVGKTMGGRVLTLESERLMNKGMKIGLEEGREEERQSILRTIMETMNLTVDQALDALRVPAEERHKYKT